MGKRPTSRKKGKWGEREEGRERKSENVAKGRVKRSSREDGTAKKNVKISQVAKVLGMVFSKKLQAKMCGPYPKMQMLELCSMFPHFSMSLSLP